MVVKGFPYKLVRAWAVRDKAETKMSHFFGIFNARFISVMQHAKQIIVFEFLIQSKYKTTFSNQHCNSLHTLHTSIAVHIASLKTDFFFNSENAVSSFRLIVSK